MTYPVMYVWPAACWCSLCHCFVGLGRQDQCIWGVCRGWGFLWSRFIPVRLSEQVYPSAVIPLRVLYADLLRLKPGPSDASACGLHQSDGNPTLDVSACTVVGLLSLFVRRLYILFRVCAASTRSNPSMKVKNGEIFDVAGGMPPVKFSSLLVLPL